MARALLLGFLIGLPIAASPGPISFLVLRRTLARGWPNGLISGLGVATGDAIYAALAAFGVVAITSLLLGQRRWISLVGGIAIIVIGARIVMARPELKVGPIESAPTAAYFSTVALTLSNPTTILSFTAVFAGLGLRVDTGWRPAVALVAGVMIGSALWWVVLTGAVSALRARLTTGMARGIGFATGIALIALGVLSASNGLR